MTQIESARKGIVTPEVRHLAKRDGVASLSLSRNIARGRAVVLSNNKRRPKKVCAVGLGLRTKINANIGTSPDKDSISLELKKLRVALDYGADAVMDLSIGGDLPRIRRRIIELCPAPLGTVPIYEAMVYSQRKYGTFLKMTEDDMFGVLQGQAEDGVDFWTIHCGVTLSVLKALRNKKRTLGIVSRGGAALARWMNVNHRENPFYENFDKILEISRKYDIVLSLGDGLRPGAISDASDSAQIAELRVLGKLAQRSRRAGVSVIIEGPGHLPLDQVEQNVRWQKEVTRGAPFYVLGPLVTDIAPGYDHISGAIGGAIAARAGADFLCYVTPAEHLRHPSVDDVREGVVAARIAAHSADIVKLKAARRQDDLISRARKKRDWNRQMALALDPLKAREYRRSSRPHTPDVCTMCGDYCSIKLDK
ncbi:MAG: phosphomethylpyrimidine synthase ThiC [Candidatus Omnitrophota bacterium]